MPKKIYAHIILLLTGSFSLFGYAVFGQQFNNWYFPSNAGITFNTSPPSPLYGGMIQVGTGSTAMSDKNGNLLFYSNGTTVWNRNHQIMPNGIGLYGEWATNNNIMSMPVIGSDNLYYIFTADGLLLSSIAGVKGYCYSIIDMTLNGGLGDVILKNQYIFGPSAERFTIAKHGNGSSAWFIAKDWGSKFYSYPITCAGVSLNPVISQIGLSLDSNTNITIGGDMKGSSDNQLIAQSFLYRGYIEIYQFDNFSGILSNAIRIPVSNPLGIEFSPNSKMLYITTDIGGVSNPGYQIIQYNLNVYDSAVIKASETLVGLVNNSFGKYRGYLQLSTNGKIYHASSGGIMLDAIVYPDSAGTACSFQANYAMVGGSNIASRLPKGFTNLFYAQSAQITNYTLSPCRSATFTGKTYIKGNNLTFLWDFGDGNTATQTVPSGGDTTYTSITHTFPNTPDSFYITLTVSSDTLCGTGISGKKIWFTGIPPPVPPTANFTYTAHCNGSVQFTNTSLPNNNDTLSYQWYFGDGDSSTLPSPAHLYSNAANSYTVTLIVTGCKNNADTATFTVQPLLKPVPGLFYTSNCGNLTIQFTDTSKVFNTTIAKRYIWFGDGFIDSVNLNLTFTHTYSAYDSFLLKMLVKDNNGCISDTLFMTVITTAKPVADFVYNSICAGVPFVLNNSSTVQNSVINNFKWYLNNSLLSTQPNVQLTLQQGVYAVQLQITSAWDCADSITKNLNIQNLYAFAGNDTAVWQGTPFTLHGTGGTNYNWQPAYLLQNDNTATATGILQNSQQFILKVTDNNGCVGYDSIWVNVLLPLEIPNAFSPNGDGINDTWEIKNASSYNNLSIQIFSRSGQIVHEQKGVFKAWNGTYNNKPLPAGVYYYILTINVSNKMYNGWLMIVR